MPSGDFRAPKPPVRTRRVEGKDLKGEESAHNSPYTGQHLPVREKHAAVGPCWAGAFGEARGKVAAAWAAMLATTLAILQTGVASEQATPKCGTARLSVTTPDPAVGH